MHDAIIIGGGVVGLAAAKTLSDADLKVLIVEMESRIGTGTSSRSARFRRLYAEHFQKILQTSNKLLGVSNFR